MQKTGTGSAVILETTFLAKEELKNLIYKKKKKQFKSAYKLQFMLGLKVLHMMATN